MKAELSDWNITTKKSSKKRIKKEEKEKERCSDSQLS